MGIEQDYILRLAKQIAEAVARMMGLRKGGRPDEALVVAEGAYGDLLGLPAGLIDRIDAATLARILGAPDKCRVVADLLEAEAMVLDTLGDAVRAEQRRALAAGVRPSREPDA